MKPGDGTGPYRHRVPRADRRVMLALLSGRLTDEGRAQAMAILKLAED